MDESLEELIAIVELLKEAEFSQFRFRRGELLVEVSRGEPLPQPTSALQQPAVSHSVTTPTAPDADARAAALASETTNSAGAVTGETPTPGVLADTSHAVTVESPMLGTFYGSPKPGEPPFVGLGDEVTPDTVLCIVEVMKLMNSVTAGVAGTVVEIPAADGQLVELGTPLFRINPAQ